MDIAIWTEWLYSQINRKNMQSQPFMQSFSTKFNYHWKFFKATTTVMPFPWDFSWLIFSRLNYLKTNFHRALICLYNSKHFNNSSLYLALLQHRENVDIEIFPFLVSIIFLLVNISPTQNSFLVACFFCRMIEG